jgi:hypothetical protein
MPVHSVGGEVDGHCTKCKMVLGHTILAMVGERIARVRCNTCQGEHAFKSTKPKPRATKSSGVRAKPTNASFDEQLATKNAASARSYSVNEKFALDQVIDHPTFGRGFVAIARPDKIDVVFRSYVKTLVHARGGKSPSQPPPSRPVIRPEAAVEAASEGQDSGG